MSDEEISSDNEEMDQDNTDEALDADEELSSTDSESEELDWKEIHELKEKIKAYPYGYDNHTRLIELLEKNTELELLRSAREEMSVHFPLTPKLWIDWLRDEKNLATTPEQKKTVVELFERAKKDYLSIPILVDSCQYHLGNSSQQDGGESTRKFIEDALSFGGLHVSQGCLLWGCYIEFEKAYLSLDNSKEQRDRVLKLYTRQLAIPLYGMEKTFEEYKELLDGETIDENVVRSYNKALAKLSFIAEFEDALLSSDTPALQGYKDYLEAEKIVGEKARIQCLYERAVADHCIDVPLWLDYTSFLDKKYDVKFIVLPVYERSIRNCPWVVELWLRYLRAAERHQEPADQVKGLIDRALRSGFTQPEEYEQIWLAHLDYLRRKVDWKKGITDDENPELQELRTVFQKSLKYLTPLEEAQPRDSQSFVTTTILKYWAWIEAKFCKNMEKARELWNKIMYRHAKVEAVWLEYSQLERAFGDEANSRRLLRKALHCASDNTEIIGHALVTFEREEGTLTSFYESVDKYETKLVLEHQRRLKKIQKEEEKKAALKEQRKHTKADKKSSTAATASGSRSKVEISPRASFKRKSPLDEGNDSNVTDSDGFLVPLSPAKKTSSYERFDGPQTKKQKISDEQPKEKPIPPAPSQPHQHDPTKDDQTVFLSNLAYHVTEEDITKVFEGVGKIISLRLAKQNSGRSKGFGYLEFSTKEEAQEALKFDRHMVESRPMYVSPCKDKKTNPQGADKQFKFKTSLEKNKLFVKNLPKFMSQKEVEDLFKQFGPSKEVRLVLHKSGQSKGIAYVEYETEALAAQVREKADGLRVGQHILVVAISNPPGRSQDNTLFTKEDIPSLGRGSLNVNRPRDKPRSQIFLLPRSLQKKPPQNGQS